MRKFLFFATALLTFVACTNDFVKEDLSKNTANNGAIAFNTVYKGTTRTDYTGNAAASKLNNNFVVHGVKGDGTIASQEVVFNNYNVNWYNGSANSTTSNSAGWEYVNQAVHPRATGIAAQSIKFWDYANSQYDFIAYSNGEATAVYADADYDANSNILVSAIDASKLDGVKTGTVYTDGAYTVKGKAANLAKFYIADMVTAYNPADYQNEVEFTFRSLSAKVRIALYETIPGYSVRDVKFYESSTDASPNTTAKLYTSGGGVFNEEGTYIVYFPTTGSGNTSATDYNKAHVAFSPEASDGTDTKKSFGTLANFQGKELNEAAVSEYLGRNSTEATYADPDPSDDSDHYYTIVIPNETGAVLNLKVDYKLVSTDGSSETIDVTGASAQVPMAYATWKSGYAYTYIFKISQNTNGVTNPSAGPAGLYPITFDALVAESEDGVQETITHVATPSITTYMSGKVVTDNDEYIENGTHPIYVVVNDGTSDVVLITNGDGVTTFTNAKLYTASWDDTDATTASPIEVISEASVGNALKYGVTGTVSGQTTHSVKDAHGWRLVVTDVTDAQLTGELTSIPADESPTGNAITVPCASFVPVAGTTYVFQYIIDESAGEYQYKVIKVASSSTSPTTPTSTTTPTTTADRQNYGNLDNATWN